MEISRGFSESCAGQSGRRELLNVRTKRVFSMKSIVDMLTSRLVTHAAKTRQTPDPSDQTGTGLAAAAEYWAWRAIWVLVMATSLWDIHITFARPLTLAARLF